MTRTVVITGLGTTSPLGGDVAATWQGLREGRSGIDTLEHEWAEGLPCRIAAEAAVDPTSVLDRVKARKMDRSTQLAMVAGAEAWADAGFDADSGLDPERVGVSVGTGIGGLQTLIGAWDVQRDRGPRRVSPWAIPMLMANAPAANLALHVGAKAGVHAPVSACASGNEAIAQGLDMIRLGRADIVVVGGAEGVIHPLPMAAFANMHALSRRNDEPQRASRPWDTGRDGFVLGEGAALLVIETLESAQARGARIYATLAGAGISADGHDLVQPDPSGTGQYTAMIKALEDSGLSANDIKHINAHATSTPQGDLTEAASIRRALGEAVDDVVVTGTKSMTGHLLGAAGALETLASVLALRERIVPPTINLEDREPDLGIDIATSARELAEGDLAALNNSFGFGGHNVAIAVTNANVTR